MKKFMPTAIILLFVFFSSFAAIKPLTPEIKREVQPNEDSEKMRCATRENSSDCFLIDETGTLFWIIKFNEDPAFIYFGLNSLSDKDFQAEIDFQTEFIENMYIYILKVDLKKIPIGKFKMYFNYPNWDTGKEEFLSLEIEAK